jgi:5'-nucleotidase
MRESSRRCAGFRPASLPAENRHQGTPDGIERIGPLARVAALISAGLGGCAGFGDVPPSRPITLTLLHTNDTHSHLEPFPRDDELSAGHQGPQQGGIARRKALIDAIRAREPNVLLVDAGDSFQGTIFYNAWKGSAEIMALNALGYDAVTLGNHEFDRGPAELGRALRGEPVEIAGAVYPTEKLCPPIVATHVDARAEPALRGLFAPSAVLERGGERFGILGVVTEDVPAISSPGPNVRFLDAVSSVQAEADRLRAAGIDVIVSGHDHALLGDPAAVEAVAPGQGERIKGPYPTVTAGADGAPVLVVSAHEWGRWLGPLKVTFDERGVIRRWEGQPIFVRGCAFARGAVDCGRQSAPEDPAVAAQVASYRAPLDRFADAVIGRAGMFFDGGRTPGLRTREMPLGNLVADAMWAAAAQSDGAVAAIVNGGGIRAGLNAGDATFEEALAVLPFGNTVAVSRVCKR